ncbi:MAG: neutral/alkaline non-lysosomal ceramidase N-terminal domain-containing protein [Planctomycetaceae bacterium]
MFCRAFLLLNLAVAVGCPCPVNAETPYRIGFGKSDITPTLPLRLSGYGNRTEPSEGIDEPLSVRAMALRSGDEGPLHVIVSVDTIGVPGTLTKEIHQRIAQQHEIPRAQFVLCCTHSHTAPQIVGALTNLFAKPPSDDERRELEQYAQHLSDQAVAAVEAAIENMQPSRLFFGQGEATFAVNRRVLNDGVWTGFGITPDGPVDHSLPILKVTDETGEQIRGVLFNYACHCTTFDSNYNRINGDWAGYATKYIEEQFPHVTALCTIGCGADANPERDRDRDMQIAKAQGRQIADEVQQATSGEMTEITAGPQAAFGFAGLPSDRPTVDELKANLKDNSPQVRQHAENMLDVLKRMGRLPETYPMPLQSFRFGDQFSMVFLSGEVCVDYAFRIKKELGEDGKPPVWVTAYANDVFGYVAPERMQTEGGYEVDYSMIYYNLPGRWLSGTEDLILKRLHELYENQAAIGPVSPETSLSLITVPNGYTVDLIAAEPLIRDPVNFALGADGNLWVVEMGDYPRGEPGAAGTVADNDAHPENSPPGGRVKLLKDANGDGRYDEATLFLTELKFPSGIFPWRGGVVVVAAPEIVFARDTDGDGVADERRLLFSGFYEGNPQHRISGVAYGLDGWLYLSGGAYNGEVTSHVTGKVTDVTGRDVRIHPDKGLIEPLSGQSQYGRCRDDWGNWFGNTNSEPLFHYAIEDPYLQRNPFVPSPEPRVFVTEPARIPPVYPTSRAVDRFNDLHTLNRFTSACAPLIVRNAALGEDFVEAALICEPVHNLVSRVILDPDGVTFRSHRLVSEEHSEFLSSRDNWFRPVFVRSGPDASLWVCDMYRETIEHPRWIPESWQARLDLYAGNDRGRLYRIRPDDQQFSPTPNLAGKSSAELVDELQSGNGWRRDTAQRLLIERGDASVAASLVETATHHTQPNIRVQAMSTLAGLDRLVPETLVPLLADDDPQVVRVAIRFSESQIENPEILSALCALSQHHDLQVRYQLALSLGESREALAAEVLLDLALRDDDDPWMRAAVLSSAVPHADALLTHLLASEGELANHSDLLQELVVTSLGDDVTGGVYRVLKMITDKQSEGDIKAWQLLALNSCMEAVRRRGETWTEVAKSVGEDERTTEVMARPLFNAARQIAGDEQAPVNQRVTAVGLLGQASDSRDADIEFLASLISPRVAVELQIAAVNALAACQSEGLGNTLLADWAAQTPAVRSEVVSTLLSRSEWTGQFLDTLERGIVAVGELDAATRNRLQSFAHQENLVSAQQLFASTESSRRSEVITAFQEVPAHEGNVERGALIFKKVCSNCHKHAGIGNDLGPQLANLKNKSADALLTAILDPNQAVEHKFRGFTVVTSDGRVVNGLLKSETASSLTLVEPSGKEHVLLRIDIEEMQNTGKSFMPEGLEKDLTPQDLADVIAFVAGAQ